MAVAAALTPAGNTASGWLAGVYPHWLLPSYNSTAGFPKAVLIPTLLVTLVIDGVIVQRRRSCISADTCCRACR